MVSAARYAVEITHRRRDPIDYGFRTNSSTWLIDLDDVPALPRGLRWLCRFSPADHLGGPAGTLRSNLDRFLAGEGVERPARIRMLANPRVLGYVFNPLSVFYCSAAEGEITHAVAEVRNTYGGRHNYLVRLDPEARAAVDKSFYVSPFYTVEGRYRMQLPPPGKDVHVSVILDREDEQPFVAVLNGSRVGGSSLWNALRTPLATRAVMAQIKRHGLALYVRGLRPKPRPTQHEGDLE